MGSTISEVEGFGLLDASISDLLSALDNKQITSVELVAKYLRRISVYDANGLKLSAIPIINPKVFEEAAASDASRASGQAPRPLEGIPFLVKDNIKVKGMTVAAGAPAFEGLVATQDAACVSILRAAGAVVLGRTNMPAMANGGMQRGSYGRAESPYNLEYLTAAYASGSSNGSATAVASNFAVFGLGTETVSSGRSPASNNSLVAYTPSRGLLPLRGVWHLYPTCDVLVPHTRTMEDMLRVLDVLRVSDANPSGDFWNAQTLIPLPPADELRPQNFLNLSNAEGLKGKRLGVPSMYIGRDSRSSVVIRPSVRKLWEQARKHLEACGATVVEVDFPLVSTYEDYEPDGVQWANIRNLPENWLVVERCELISHAWDDFLVSNAQPGLDSLTCVDPDLIFPLEPGSLQGETEEDNQLSWQKIVDYPRHKASAMEKLPGMEQALQALENARKETLEDWMEQLGLDAVVFPANGDVGPANADRDEVACQAAWRNGVLYSNGNLPMRHLGVPSISVPMGVMEDTRMPVNLTFIGKAYDDNLLLELGCAFEAATRCREMPSLVPALDSDYIPKNTVGENQQKRPAASTCKVTVSEKSKEIDGDLVRLSIRGTIDSASDLQSLTCYVNGEEERASVEGKKWTIQLSYPVSERDRSWTRWSSPLLVQTIVVVVCRFTSGQTAGELIQL
ncbi:hypothetical protein QQS21_000955 [Conoideocrella luteorostrata]|uniref:Amidase domain-containing protein n=1 Tax=Conoideocrella luteorostrata TaxID=1105319 RepID=A0AAJ0CXZ0_9HYPO|nr:hypothetical protein QQS21_000955 [Conoideocrella luteorostrata]